MNPFYIYLILILIFDAIALISAKFYSLHHHPLALLGAMGGFAFTGFFLCKSLAYQGVAIANIIWISLSAIIGSVIGYFYFKENITLIQGVGIGILIIGLILINIE